MYYHFSNYNFFSRGQGSTEVKSGKPETSNNYPLGIPVFPGMEIILYLMINRNTDAFFFEKLWVYKIQMFRIDDHLSFYSWYASFCEHF